MINGNVSDEVLLGVNGVEQRDHDAAACLVVGGEVVAAAEQERFSRNKKAFDELPHDAIAFCLESTGVDVREIDAITVGWSRATATSSLILPPQYTAKLDREIPIHKYGHHRSHAASAFYPSPFETAAVLVVDGEGEDESISIWNAGPNGLEQVESVGVDKSLGYLYASISRYCGFGSFGAGKIMGLAPYGEPKYTEVLQDIYNNVTLTDKTSLDAQDEYINGVLARLQQRGFAETHFSYEYDPLTQKAKKIPEIVQIHMDMAASVQKLLEAEMIKLAVKAKELTGSSNLCLAGGVAMNCVANSAIENAGIFEEVYLQPACEDNGVALGSALAHKGAKVDTINPFLGPSFSDYEIGQLLAKRGISAESYRDVEAAAAKLLADGKIVGWFQGALEYGPRALGNRSILANPSLQGMHKLVSAAKRRELWRPFGPSVLAERASDLFQDPVPSPYMLRSFTVKPEWRERLGATVHVDGSTRPQTVTASENPRYHSLIKNFLELTGVPAVLNTSFNDDREPIVSTPDDAIRTFYTTGLDALVIGNRILRK